MLDGDLQAKIQQVVRTSLSPIDVAAMSLIEGHDQSGNGVIFVTVTLPARTGPVPAHQYMHAMSETSQLLLAADDERMPLFRTVREDELEAVGDDKGHPA